MVNHFVTNEFDDFEAINLFAQQVLNLNGRSAACHYLYIFKFT